MHELAVTQELMKQAISESRCLGIIPERIYVKLGVLTAYTAHSMQYFFEIVKKGTLLENAELIVEEVKGKIYCHACKKESVMVDDELLCKHCSSFTVSVISGKECVLTKIVGL